MSACLKSFPKMHFQLFFPYFLVLAVLNTEDIVISTESYLFSFKEQNVKEMAKIALN